MQSLWRRVRNLIDRSGQAGHGVMIDERLHRSLLELAQRESRPLHEIADEMLSFALTQRWADVEHQQCWHRLTDREQQVVALICLGYANRQIAAWLVVSPETVKSHTRNALRKFRVSDKTQLRKRLANWEFADWQPEKFR